MTPAESPSPDLEHGAKEAQAAVAAHPPALSRAKALFAEMLRHNLETRGITRVLPSERHTTARLGYTQVAILWFTDNLAAINITMGMLGPAAFALGFTDAALCGVAGIIVGSLPVAYMATFGPRSGLRSLVVARYSMGWWPVKLLVLLNIVLILGYAIISSNVAGQTLSAVSDASLPLAGGIVILPLIALVVTTFGYDLIHYYVRFTWIPQLIVVCILAGVAGPHFDLATPSAGDALTVIGNRISFFSLCLSASVTYAAASSDVFVYYPTTSPSSTIFLATLAGLYTSFTLCILVGVGLGSGVASLPSWNAAYATSQGALIVEALSPLGTFGKFCAVLIAIGLVPNIGIGIYVAGIDAQILGRWCAAVPRLVWNLAAVATVTVCAVAGREALAAIFTNFLPLMGYWVAIFVVVMLEEDFFFAGRGAGFVWGVWDDRARLPLGAAALAAFLVGWAGAVVGMNQVWYRGPLAGMVGANGADLGVMIAAGFAAVVFPVLRVWEKKWVGK